jgi:predicted nucleic-acid-binding protein
VGAGALIAIDTNIILRFLTRQPKAQFEAARSLFRSGGLFVSTPVVMEVYFTLTGSVLAFADDHALEALDAVLRLPGVEVQQADEVFAAIAYARQGLPFKDACVLAFSADASRLVTFDKPFSKRAAKLKLRPVVQVP